MSFIDWSDPEEMFGLLVEYVADEQSDAIESTRRAFLADVREQLDALRESFETVPLGESIGALRTIRDSIGGEFETDPVVAHLSACVEELERVRASVA